MVEHTHVPITALIPHPSNYQQHPQEQINELIASLLRFGQVKPIVVQRVGENRFMIIAGHGLSEAMKQIVAGHGLSNELQQLLREHPEHAKRCSTADIVIVPDDWSPLMVKAYLVADNLLPGKALPDQTQLVALLEEQLQAGELLASIGSSEEELQKLLDSLDSALSEDAEGNDEELLPISDESSFVETIPNLRFGKYIVPLTDEEFAGLEERLKRYGQETGSYYGFVGSVLR